MNEWLNSSTIQKLSSATNMKIKSNDDVLSAIDMLLGKLDSLETTEPDILFPKNNMRYCRSCGKLLSPNSKESICWLCKDQELFEEVKEYIRNNDVREYEVATKFNIPVSHVRKWIREGWIQYKEGETAKIATNCAICGTSILFGTMCAKCLKAQTHSGLQAPLRVSEPGGMWFLNDKWSDKKG